MNLNRRTVVATALASPLIMRTSAAANEPQAGIKVNTQDTRGAIDRKIYGNFVEHLGRCIDGGIFQEGLPLSNAAGYRRDVLEAVRGLDVKPAALAWRQLLLELPLDGRHRTARRPAAAPRDGVGHRREQPLRHARVPRLCRAAPPTEPYICANLGTGTWTEAQQWVEYCNSAEDTAITRMRRARTAARTHGK